MELKWGVLMGKTGAGLMYFVTLDANFYLTCSHFKSIGNKSVIETYSAYLLFSFLTISFTIQTCDSLKIAM